uniref:Uncharacterized protein n=1 Tax=Ceratitis capitata TaxID=7213 RepID=W8B9V9_CERCA
MKPIARTHRVGYTNGCKLANSTANRNRGVATITIRTKINEAAATAIATKCLQQKQKLDRIPEGANNNQENQSRATNSAATQRRSAQRQRKQQQEHQRKLYQKTRQQQQGQHKHQLRSVKGRRLAVFSTL